MLVISPHLNADVAGKVFVYRAKVFAYALGKGVVGLKVRHFIESGPCRALARTYDKHYAGAFLAVYHQIIRGGLGVVSVCIAVQIYKQFYRGVFLFVFKHCLKRA